MEPDRKTAENALQFIRRSVPPNLLQIMTYILQKDFWGHALRYSLLFYEIMADMQRKYSIILFFLILTMEPGSTVLQILPLVLLQLLDSFYSSPNTTNYFLLHNLCLISFNIQLGTNVEISPPNRAISFTTLELKNILSELVVRNTVSSPLFNLWLVNAI